MGTIVSVKVKNENFILVMISALVFMLTPFWLPVGKTQESSIPAVTYSVGKYKSESPNWSQITWSNLPSVLQSGSITVPQEVISKIGYDPSRSWSAGQKPDSIVMLGDVEDAFKISSLSLKNIQTIISSVPVLTLKDFGLMQWQTPASLVKAIPTLGSLDVSQVKPIEDLFSQAGISSSGTIAQILESNPQAASLPLGNLDLSQYSIDSIPTLTNTELNKFKDWQKSYINQVPGLNKLRMDKLPQPISAGVNVVGIASVVLGKAEHGDPKVGDSYYISGRVDSTDKTVPVGCQSGKECAYMELGDFKGNGALYGKRWVSGLSQKVKGGFGILSSVNGGLEPTGRLVYGSGFKVALTNINESIGTAEFGLYFRVCAHIPFGGKTCTPYFIGPVPWLPVKENDLVVVGTGR